MVPKVSYPLAHPHSPPRSLRLSLQDPPRVHAKLPSLARSLDNEHDMKKSPAIGGGRGLHNKSRSNNAAAAIVHVRPRVRRSLPRSSLAHSLTHSLTRAAAAVAGAMVEEGEDETAERHEAGRVLLRRLARPPPPSERARSVSDSMRGFLHFLRCRRRRGRTTRTAVLRRIDK